MLASAMLAVLALAVAALVAVKLVRLLLLKLAAVVVILGVLAGLWLLYGEPLGRVVAEQIEALAARPEEL